MGELREDTWTMPAGRLGGLGPLPALGPLRDAHAYEIEIRLDDSVPEEHRKYFGYGRAPGCLPYRLQPDYDRVREPRTFRTAVLENEILRATFLLGFGGRLWSLLHKPSGRELLCVNPVFQPCNLAIRRAWFSGGVEWNVGFLGHSPFTCSPLFAARVTGDDGGPILRLYEWERVRRVPFQMDFMLPDGSPFLLVRVRLVNPHDHETPMYWWSNIAAPEEPGTRIIVPADKAFTSTYKQMVREISVKPFDLAQATYPTRLRNAGDHFYLIEENRRPWIASLDETGRGLVHVSTSRLRGRKLWRWGMGPGGRRWQDFLSPGGPPYIELQGGLTYTQGECLPMPPRAEWSWLEAYGLMEANPDAVHGDDWHAAVNAVETRLLEMLPAGQLETTLGATAAAAARKPDEIIGRGSGWGALERRRRERAGEDPFCSEALRFDDESLGPDQEPWLALLEDGALPERDPAEEPGAWMVQPEWRRLLEDAARAGRGDHWLAWLHLGVMAHYARDAAAARPAWERSLELTPSGWAYRNLAFLAADEGRADEAADRMLAARQMLPRLAPLAVESGHALVRAGRHQELIKLADKLPGDIRELARIRMLEAQAAIELDDFDRARKILDSKLVVTDLRESEETLSELWFRLHERRIAAAEHVPIDDALRERVEREFPPPPHLEFRMSTRRRRRRSALCASARSKG